MRLNWPSESANRANVRAHHWYHPSSNYCLDLHGDPSRAEVAVFSDGNHHMALEQSLQTFQSMHDLESVFYCTTPPKVYLDWLTAGAIELGNLRICRQPDVLIGPDDVMAKLCMEGAVANATVFARSEGMSLLFARGNPKGLALIDDLMRDDVRMFISNPVTEKASHVVYRETIERRMGDLGPAIEALFRTDGETCFGEVIHHREAPQCIADGRADVAIIYSHLALRYTRIFPEIFEQMPLPRDEHNVTTRYAIGAVSDAAPLGNELVEFFFSDVVAQAYTHHGLVPVREYASS